MVSLVPSYFIQNILTYRKSLLTGMRSEANFGASAIPNTKLEIALLVREPREQFRIKKWTTTVVSSFIPKPILKSLTRNTIESGLSKLQNLAIQSIKKLTVVLLRIAISCTLC